MFSLALSWHLCKHLRGPCGQPVFSTTSSIAKAVSDTMQAAPGASKDSRQQLYSSGGTGELMVFRQPGFWMASQTQHHCGGAGSLTSLNLFGLSSDP